MAQKIIVGPINKGLRNDRLPFVIDNDSFPVLINAYQWRGRIKRKRGTSLLTRLQRALPTSNIGLSLPSPWQILNLYSTYQPPFVPESNSQIVPGSVVINIGAIVLTDQGDGTLQTNPISAVNGTINYTLGNVEIFNAPAGVASTLSFAYYPVLPVMGLEDLTLIPTQFPGTIAFDTKYSYNILTSFPYNNYNVSFYKNPDVNPTILPLYVPKANPTPLTWNGQDYQQFFSINYQGAFWAANGISVPFDTTKLGMQFSAITAVGVPTPTQVDITVTGSNLIVGDFVFFNEFDPAIITGINFQTGYIIAGSSPGIITVKLPNAQMAGPGGATTKGIVQYLTNRSDTTKDNIRFYDGDPTGGQVLNPTFPKGHGWVNFQPPLSQSNFSISDLPAAQYYLVGARLIVPFKDRLLFLGPVVQTSDANALPIYLQDTIVYSQNGTPYYTASYVNTPTATIDTPTSASNVFHELLVPDNQTATSSSWFEDSAGFGGFISAGISQPIITVSTNEDVLIVGFDRLQARVIYSGNDIVPFNFFVINSELGSGSTFSTINMDKGVITRGSRGFIITSQVESQRIDLQIPDEVFEINLTQNGNERFCAARDFINEWIYFTYPVNSETQKFNNQSLLYNYRDGSWAIFKESYTTYGSFKRQTGFTWQTIGTIYSTWLSWNEPWNAGDSTLLQQEVIAGNQQGFVIVRDEGTDESASLFILSFSGASNIVTSPNHNLSNGDYIIINNCIGSVAQFVNGEIFSVFNVTTDTFQLKDDPQIGTASYFGNGTIKKIYVPFIQTKQFPVAWEMSRKTRLGPQQYLLTSTQNSQITLLIYLSQNSSSPYNTNPTIHYPIVPEFGSLNNSLIYSAVLYTCPESTNLGLSPANINLQMPTAIQQNQIWHRVNTSLIGDTVQIGFTLSDEQIRSLNIVGQSFLITGATQSNPCILTSASEFEIGDLIEISNVTGMTELNNNRYQVIAITPTTVTINVDSTSFSSYISGGIAVEISSINGYSEIELHGFILDVSPSQVLA